MLPRLLPLAGLVATALLFSACASNAPRTIALQAVPTKLGAQHPIEAGEVVVALADQRQDRTLDPILSAPVVDTVNAALRRALADSKLVQAGPGNAPKFEIKGSITKLEWFVPGYRAMLKKAFATSFLTGGIGGLAYGSTSTPVQGHATLDVTVTHDGREILHREYSGTHEESLAKLKCDSMDTKSRVAGLALAAAIDKLIADLDAAKPGPAVTPAAPPAQP